MDWKKPYWEIWKIRQAIQGTTSNWRYHADSSKHENKRMHCGSKDHKAIACNTMQDIDDSGQQTHQRWINVEKTFIKVVSTLIFGWNRKLSRRTFIDVVSTLTKRWNDVDRIMSIQRRWTNVVLMFKFGWKWKLSRRMFNDVVSALTNQRWNNVDTVTLIQCWWLNVASTLILGWKGKLSQRMFIGVEKTLLKQLCQYFLYWGFLESDSIIKQN